MIVQDVKLCINDLDFSAIKKIDLDMEFVYKTHIVYELNFNKTKVVLGYQIVQKLIALLKKINAS